MPVGIGTPKQDTDKQEHYGPYDAGDDQVTLADQPLGSLGIPRGPVARSLLTDTHGPHRARLLSLLTT